METSISAYNVNSGNMKHNWFEWPYKQGKIILDYSGLHSE